MTVRVTVGEAFVRALKKLPPDRADKASNALVLFMREPTPPRLRFRTLKGYAGYFIIDAARGDRIILKLVSDGLYEAVDVGTHDVYRKWDRRR